MKTPTNKLSVQSAFSLVELLVVIAVIAVIAAIAIPNIAGITQNAQSSTDKRNAQNLASLYSAAVAAGATSANFSGATKTAIIGDLISTTGVTVTNGGTVFGPFRADGLTANGTYSAYLTANMTYDPAGGH